MIPTAHITDLQRVEFLEKLRCSDLLLTEWEMRFTSSYRLSSRPTLWFTQARKAATDRMWLRLGVLLNHPYPTDDVRRTASGEARVAPAALPEAEANACMYFKRDENRQLVRCNEPAVRENRAGFRYCLEHAELAQKQVKRGGGSLALRTYLPKPPQPACGHLLPHGGEGRDEGASQP